MSWVPIETSWAMGAIMKARNMNVGDVAAGGELGRRTCWWAPRYMTRAPTTPRTTVEASDMMDCAVSELMTLARRRWTPAAKTLRFAVFGVVALDDADAAERFGEAAGDFGVDLGALAEDGADGLEGALAG